MAIARGNTADLGDKSGSSGTFTTGSFNLGAAGQKVVVILTQENNGSTQSTVTAASITSGSSFSRAVQHAWGAFQTNSIFVLDTTVGGTVTFDIAYSPSDAGFRILVAVYTGAGLNGGVVDNSTTAVSGTNSSSLSTSVTINTANSWVIMTGVDFANSIVAGTGATTSIISTPTFCGIFDSNTSQGTGSYTIGFTGNTYAGILDEEVIVLAPKLQATHPFFMFMPN